MNIKRLILLIFSALTVCSALVLVLFASDYGSGAELDAVAVNDIAETLSEKWDSITSKSSELPCPDYKLDYTVLDSGNRLIAATRDGLSEDISSAVKNRDTIVDIIKDGKPLGKLIVYNNTEMLRRQSKNNLLLFSVLIMLLTAVLCILYLFYIDNRVFKPFRRLQGFARHVAAGNLDMPLEMDRENLFGAFTESFDLMREELNKARESERQANRSKKELVASLSHDIKTPVASIKAVTELLYIKSKDEAQKKQLEIINSKADQINTLISNMFSATLEELQELKVTVTEEPSSILYDLIKNADYNSRVSTEEIDECIILADVTRLAQIIDNIISNSYKYAGTSIDVSAQINGKYLEVSFKDYGLGVPEEEMPLIFNKFYRGKNSAGKSGSGLGFYISKYLINKMSGEMECENTGDGFAVRLKLLMA
jgi:signal transduction histidine kinase